MKIDYFVPRGPRKRHPILSVSDCKWLLAFVAALLLLLPILMAMAGELTLHLQMMQMLRRLGGG